MENQKKTKVLFALLLVLLLAIIAFWGYTIWGLLGDSKTPDPDNKYKLTVDKNATDDGTKDMSKEEIQAALNKKVADGMIEISMNTNPIFETGTSKGTLKISNSKNNKYPQQVEIYTTADNKLIYSGAVEVGGKIETSNLSVDLPAGIYDCTAYFTAVDTTTDTKVGTAGANIKITVLH